MNVETQKVYQRRLMKKCKPRVGYIRCFRCFFADKPEMFKSAFLIGKAKQFCYFRQNSAFYGLKNIYDEINCKLNSISHKTRQALPLPYRIGLSIHNIPLLKIYVGILKYLKINYYDSNNFVWWNGKPNVYLCNG